MTWELKLGDCLDPATGLSSLPDKSVDVIITDPPYGSHIYEKHSGNQAAGGAIQCPSMAELASWDGIDNSIGSLCQHFSRLAKRWMCVFSDEETAYVWMSTMGDDYFRTGAWVRTNPVSLNDCYPARGLESLTIAHPRDAKKRWNGGQNRAAVYIGEGLSGASAVDERHGHPCPKPLWLMSKVVGHFSDPGELILDPFAGSGTTGMAAIQSGRRFIGWERDRRYHAAAVRRLQGTREQTDLFRPKAPKAKQGVLL